MSESPVTLRDAMRRRRANVAGGRRGDHRVKTSPEEEAVLLRLAAEQGVTVPRLLVESAMAGDRATAAERRDGIVELFAIRRLLAGVSNNVNQVAKKANAASDFPAEAAAVLDAVRRLVPRISAAAEALADPARGRDTRAGGRGTGR
jgi:hypothetical protein